MRISKEIQQFASGKDGDFAWEKPEVSAALTIEQKRILEERGVLSPAEIHRLAGKLKRGEEDGSEADDKLACHSDYVDDDAAKQLHAERIQAPQPAKP